MMSYVWRGVWLVMISCGMGSSLGIGLGRLIFEMLELPLMIGWMASVMIYVVLALGNGMLLTVLWAMGDAWLQEKGGCSCSSVSRG